MTDGLTPHYPSAIAQVRHLIRTEDLEELARHTAWLAEAGGHRWDGEARVVVDLLRAMPDGARSHLAALLPVDHPYGAQPSSLPGLIAAGLAPCAVDDARRELLERYGRRYAVDEPQPLVWAAEAELAAGRTLPPAAVAVVRRSAHTAQSDPVPLSTLAARLVHPVLNPGEAWADAALDRAGTAESVWHRLLRHTRTATAARPSARWDEAARASVEEIGAEEVSGAVVSWLSLTDSPRTLPFDAPHSRHDDTPDPYNTTALRGLAWLTALLPPHPDAARVLGLLVESSLRQGPDGGRRAPRVATAAVLALTRIPGHAAGAELARLGTRVTHQPTLKQIGAALDVGASLRPR